MNKRWMSMLCVLMMAAAGLLSGGCEDDLNPQWEFQNRSSYRIAVTANGQSWGSALLDPGESLEVDHRGDTIQYVYSPSNKVRPEGSSSKRRVTFYNR